MILNEITLQNAIKQSYKSDDFLKIDFRVLSNTAQKKSLDAKSDFSLNCTKILQAHWRMSKDLCVPVMIELTV